MKSDKSMPNLGTKEDKDAQSVSRLHMGFYDIERMDQALLQVHSMLFELRKDQTLRNAVLSHDALRHSFLIFKYAYKQDDRDYIEKRLHEIKNNLNRMENDARSNFNYRVQPAELSNQIEFLFEVLDAIYRAKQNAGLGIPRETFTGAEARIKAAMRS